MGCGLEPRLLPLLLPAFFRAPEHLGEEPFLLAFGGLDGLRALVAELVIAVAVDTFGDKPRGRRIAIARRAGELRYQPTTE